MILTMRITSKGQVTIPKAVREEAGLWPGMEVDFAIEDGEVVVRRAKGERSPGRQLVEHLRASGQDYTMTTAEVMRLTRGED